MPISDTAWGFVKPLTFTGPEEIVDADLLRGASKGLYLFGPTGMT